ncbi:hypothetical protein [Micromonospora coerulea]|uniref:hypothetical protein n=1 Tax=Micromonospora coerulea TaxID=47856 RepID=UPI0031F74DD1
MTASVTTYISMLAADPLPVLSMPFTAWRATASGASILGSTGSPTHAAMVWSRLSPARLAADVCAAWQESQRSAAHGKGDGLAGARIEGAVFDGRGLHCGVCGQLH